MEPVELERARDEKEVQEERRAPSPLRAQRELASEMAQEEARCTIKAVEPGLLSLWRATVLQQLLRHEKRSRRAGRRAAQRGSSTVPRRVQGGRLLVIDVAPGVVVVVVLRVLDVGLGVDVAAAVCVRVGVAKSRRRRGGAKSCRARGAAPGGTAKQAAPRAAPSPSLQLARAPSLP